MLGCSHGAFRGLAKHDKPINLEASPHLFQSMAKRTPKSLVHQASLALSRVDADHDRAETAAWHACRALDELRDELPEGTFEDHLREQVGMSYSGAKMVSEVFADRDDFLHSSAQAVALVPEAQATTARLQKAHEAHLADPATRTALSRSPRTNHGWEGDSMAPLLDWIHGAENGLTKTVKGEAIARMDLYIRSGWAEKDLGPAGECETHNAGSLRDVFQKLRSGETVSPHEMKASLDARWQEVFVPVRVDKVHLHDQRHDKTAVAFESGVPTFSMDGKGMTEAGGRIDGFIRDARDPKAWHMAFASTSEDSRKQGDQMTRHVGGVLTGMAISAPPWEEGGHRIASVSYYAPAIASESRAKAMDLTSKQQEAINRLALYAQLDDPYVRQHQGVGDAVLATTHYAIGAGRTTTGRELVPQEQRDMSPAHHARQAVDAVKALANVDWDRAFRNTGEKSGREIIIPLAQSALDGLAKHYPDALAELKKAVPHLKRLSGADGIAHTGLERDLLGTAAGLKHVPASKIQNTPTLTDDHVGQLKRHIAIANARDTVKGVVHEALHKNVDAQDEEGNTALHVAAGERDLQLTQKLLSRRIDATAQNAEGQSALHVAAGTSARTARAQNDQAQLVALLAPHSALDTQDQDGNTAMHLAAAKGLDRTVGELLRHGADPSLRNQQGEKPVDLARGYARQVSSPTLRLSADRSAMTLEIAEQQRAMVMAQFKHPAQMKAERETQGRAVDRDVAPAQERGRRVRY
ncbi:ankyrin repeat domain-containing protein [Pseudoxanthomonas daejeonensis]|nr:ankyrin repeat domain-containing protein [Pseudoxanthomonas daejeonensis]